MGGIWGVASRDRSEFALIYVFVEGLAERLSSRATVLAVLAACGVLTDGNRVPAHLAPRTKEDTARLPDVLPGPAPGRSLPDRLAPRGSKVPRKAGLGAISRRSAGTPASGGRYSGVAPATHRAFSALYKLRDSGVARLPLFGNFSYSAIFLHNFSLTKYYPRWETKE